MGNAIFSRGHHGCVKIMKQDGQVLKLKVPLIVNDILADYPGHVILHSEAVRHMGVKAKPLHGYATLNPKNLYFLVELPKLENRPMRVLSGVQSMLLYNSVISHMNSETVSDANVSEISEGNGVFRVKVRMRKAELIEIVSESRDSSETAKTIVNSCLNNGKYRRMERRKVKEDSFVCKPSAGSVTETC